MKHLILLVFLPISLNLFSQRYNAGEELYVIAEGGLNMRSEPNFDGEKIALLTKGSKVKINELPASAVIKLANGYQGKWVEVAYGDNTGYVFDAYLSKLSPIEFKVDENGCWHNNILEEMANQIGKLPPIKYSNYSDGESTHSMVIYPLVDGNMYIDHTYWEQCENELQLSGLTLEEIDQFVRSILKFCKDKYENLDILGEDRYNYYPISAFEDCCLHNLNIIITGDKLIIKMQQDAGS